MRVKVRPKGESSFWLAIPDNAVAIQTSTHRISGLLTATLVDKYNEPVVDGLGNMEWPDMTEPYASDFVRALAEASLLPVRTEAP